MFFNREYQLTKLKELFKLNKASIAVCWGRRRIGKSALIEEFGKSAYRFINIQGLSPEDYKAKSSKLPPPHILLKDQLENFDNQLSIYTKLPPIKPNSWLQAFTFLNSAIKDEPTVVLLDEISWMSLGDNKFPGTLKIAWDTQLSHHSNLVLVLCGSVSSWIIRNIIKGTGFRGRISLSFKLDQLTIYHSNMFWNNAPGYVSPFEKFKVLSVTGGVPKYLEEIDATKSAENNILRLCYQEEGYLFQEYKAIFYDTFGARSETYKKIVEKLAKGHQTTEDIAKHLGWSKGGTVNKYLEDLVESGFVSKYYFKHPGAKISERKIRYRLTDNYLRFFIKYIKPKILLIENKNFEQINLETLPGWDTLMGFQFENLVLNNWKSICAILRLTLPSVIWAGPYYRKKTKSKCGCQVDLLIETKYTIYVCEVKFRKNIKNSIIEEMQDKIKRLGSVKNLSIKPVLIYVGEIEDSIASSKYFSEIIDFEQFLKNEPSY